jgi:hypothetical protein
MKNPWIVFWRWSNRRGAGFDCSSSCLGTVALIIILSQKLWNEWLHASPSLQLLQMVENYWLYLLAMLGVYSYEAWILSRHLRRRVHRSGWWAVPLMLPIIVFAACPPNWFAAHGFLLGAFILPQLPLFIDRNGKAAGVPVIGGKELP